MKALARLASLTVLAVAVVLVRVALAKALAWPDVGALLVVLAHYTGKNLIEAKKDAVNAVNKAHAEALEALAASVKKLEDRSIKQDMNALGRGR